MSPEDPLTEDLARAARMFRLGMEADGNDCLVRVVDGLIRFLALAPPESRVRVEAAVAEVVAAQERGDVLRIADLAEFELLPLVGRTTS